MILSLFAFIERNCWFSKRQNFAFFAPCLRQFHAVDGIMTSIETDDRVIKVEAWLPPAALKSSQRCFVLT